MSSIYCLFPRNIVYDKDYELFFFFEVVLFDTGTCKKDGADYTSWGCVGVVTHAHLERRYWAKSPQLALVATWCKSVTTSFPVTFCQLFFFHASNFPARYSARTKWQYVRNTWRASLSMLPSFPQSCAGVLTREFSKKENRGSPKKECLQTKVRVVKKKETKSTTSRACCVLEREETVRL